MNFDVVQYMSSMGDKAQLAATQMAKAETAVKNAALNVIADELDSARDQLKAENSLDLKAGKNAIRILAPAKLYAPGDHSIINYIRLDRIKACQGYLIT